MEEGGLVYKPFATPRPDDFPDAPHAGSGKNIRTTIAALFDLQVRPRSNRPRL